MTACKMKLSSFSRRTVRLMVAMAPRIALLSTRTMAKPFAKPRFQYRIAILAAMMMVFASAVFTAHGFEKNRPHDSIKCEVCLQFAGSSGAANAVVVVGKPVLVADERVPAQPPARPFRRNVDSRLPRGPPTSV
jgi:hypothetical protein